MLGDDPQLDRLRTLRMEHDEQRAVMAARLRLRLRKIVRTAVAEGVSDADILHELNNDPEVERMIYQCTT